MFGFNESENSYKKVYENEHQGSFTHELLAGAVSFEAMKSFENKQRREGKPVHHGMAKEILAGLAGAEADKLFETKGLDYLDREKVKREAANNAKMLYESHYESKGEIYDPSSCACPPQIEQYQNW